MSCSIPRTGILLLAVFFLVMGIPQSGELLRPVPPDAQVTRFTRFNLRYALRDANTDSVQRVEFYITEDMGRTWRLYGEDPSKTSPMTIEVPGEGVYGFVSIVTDRFGNREREPVPRTRPEAVIVVHRTPPQARWLAPDQNFLGRGNRAIEFAWEAASPYFGPAPVKIQYAVDARSNHDRDAVWNNLQEGLSAAGRSNWTPPDGVSGRYNFRLIAEDRAGNLAVVYNPATITIDSVPPFIVSVSPIRSNKLANDIIVDAADGPSGSGVREIALYISENDGGTWTLVKEAAGVDPSPVKRGPGQPIPFEASHPGEYCLWPVVFDHAGNATPLPSIGVPGPYILTIDNEPPIVTLSNSFLMGRPVVLSNESRRIEWTAYDPHIMQGSGVISLSLDNGRTWQEIRSGLPVSGWETVNFPFGSQSEEAKLRVQAADEFGNIGQDISETFRLAGAQTVIESVTPVREPASTFGGYTDPYYGGDQGSPPYISPPAQGSGALSPFPPVQPPSGGVFLPPPPGGSYEYESFSQPEPAVPYMPPTARDPYLNYQPAPLQVQPPITDSHESSAGSLPRAMYGSTETSLGQIPLAGPPTYQSPSASAEPPSLVWNPSPRNGTPVVPPAASAAIPPASALPVAPPDPNDWLSGIGLPADGFEIPPPLSSADLPALPPLSDTPGSGFPFEGLGGGGMEMLSLPGEPATLAASDPQSQLGGRLRPPTPDDEPAGVLLTAPPAQVQPMPSLDDLSPPPLAVSQTARPENPRQLSEHRVGEARIQLDQGNLELALRTATEALNADQSNPRAYIILSQVYAQQDPRVNNFARAATL
ncbi:MAG: hypothetical protein FWG74_08590, partial [Planctomycetes bacterium]|nr:hypothetical protein [Planctomycetota bacterium]